MRYLILMVLSLCSMMAAGQTVTNPPTGSKPYGNPIAVPDGKIMVGRTGSYTYITPLKYTDSLLALFSLQRVTGIGNTTTNRIVIQGSSNAANGLNLTYVNGNGGGIYNRVSGADVNSLYLSNTGTFSLGNVNGIGMIRSRTQDGSNAGIEMVINSGGTASRVSGANAVNNNEFVTLSQLDGMWTTNRLYGFSQDAVNAATISPMGGVVSSYDSPSWLTGGAFLQYGGLMTIMGRSPLGGTRNPLGFQLQWGNGDGAAGLQRLAFRTMGYETSAPFSYNSWMELWHFGNLSPVTTNTNQTGISGSKGWTGTNVFYGPMSIENAQGLRIAPTTTSLLPISNNEAAFSRTTSGLLLNMAATTGGSSAVILRNHAISGIQLILGEGGISVPSSWTPSADNHVATKGYVDGAKTLTGTQTMTGGASGVKIHMPTTGGTGFRLMTVTESAGQGTVLRSSKINLTSDSYVLRGYASPAGVQATFYDGGVDANGAYTNTSDSTLKDKAIYDYSAAANIPAQAFTWKDGRDSLVQVRYFAQEVREHLPNAVHENTETGLLSVDESQVLIAKVSLLEKKNAELEVLLQALTARVEALENKE